MNNGQVETIKVISLEDWNNLGKEELDILLQDGLVILFDKPNGITSHDVVYQVRRRITSLTGLKVKVGHAGTLDPLATGLLIVLVGPAVKKQDEWQNMDKEYECVAWMGVSSDTYDIDGKVEMANDFDKNELERNERIFMGFIRQTVPVYSALKQKGKKLYTRAREGVVDWNRLPMRDVNVYKFEVLDWRKVDKEDLIKIVNLESENVWAVRINFKVSSGTYIRSIIHEWGQSVGSDGVVVNLRRTKVGNVGIENNE